MTLTHDAGPYHAIQVPILVLRVSIDVQGQLVRTQKGQGQARADTLDIPPRPEDPAHSATQCHQQRSGDPGITQAPHR